MVRLGSRRAGAKGGAEGGSRSTIVIVALLFWSCLHVAVHGVIVPGTHCVDSSLTLAPCQTSPTGTACCAAIADWNSAGCFCVGVTSALSTTEASYAAQFATACSVTKITSASDATCVSALAAQAPSSGTPGSSAPPPPPSGPNAPAYIFSLRTGTNEVVVSWAASTSTDVVAYAISSCDAANLATCASPTQTMVYGASTTSYTFSAVASPSTMVYRVKAATTTVASASTSPTIVPVVDARNSLFVSTLSTASSASSCGAWATPCDSIASALVATTSATPRKILLVPGTHGASSCGSTLGSSDVNITSVLGSSTASIDCASANRGFTITGSSAVSISGLTILNGLASTGGGIQMTNAPSVTLDDVVVSGCKSQTMGGGLHSVNSKPIIKHSIFFGNRGGNDNSGNNNRGGGAYLQTSSHATLVNVSFIDNILGASGKGAGLNVDEDSNVTANGLTFRGNKAFFAAGLFVGHGCHGTFSNIYATENEASYGAAIGVFEGGNPTFNTGLVTANVASLWGAGVIVYTGANAHFEAMSFENNRAEIGGGLFMYSQATATVTNSRMLSNVVTKYGAGVRLDDRSTLKLTNTRVSNNVATLGGGGVHVTSGAILTVVGGEMVNNTATDGAAMYCSGGSHGGGKIIASDVSVTSNTAQGLGGGVFASEACGVTITGASVFESNTASSGSSCQSLYQVGGGAFALEPNTEAAPTTVAIVGATSVSSNKAPNGGAFFVVPAPNSADANSPKGAQISLSGSTTVSSNLALGCEPSLHGRGGAFFAAAGNHTFATTTFTNNSASDDGGAVYTEGVSAVTLSACTLSGNAAASFGGAVAHTGAKLKIEAGTIQSNTAIGGGGVYIAKASSTNAASPMFAILAASMLSNNAHRGGAMYYATDLALGVLSQNALSANNATAGSDTYWLRAKSPSSEFACTACTYAHADGSSSGVIATEALGARPAMVIANRVESGKVTSDFSVQLVDFYNHAVQSEISPVTCDVEAVNDPSALARHSLEISGVAESATSNGVATFSGAIMRGVLGESYVAKVTCARDSSANLGAISSLELDVSIGLCLPGSEPLLVTHSDGVAVARECTVCKDRTFNFDGVKCKACPEGGDCRGGTSLDSLQGWWRSADSAEVLFTCPIRESCVAGNGTGAASCELGYEGPVCALCSPGYRHWGGKCSPCGSNASLAVPALGIIAFVAFLVYIFRKPLKTAVGTVIFSTVLFVAQILGLLKEYDINWPQSVGRLVEVLDITNFNMESLTPGCSGSKSSYYDTYITAVVVPPSVTLFCILVYISMGLIERNSPFPRLNKIACDARTKCRRNACWLVVLSYSGVAKTVLQLYNQRHLDVGVYLRRDYSIDASGSEHLVYRITGFIALVLYPVGIPAVITFILLRNRHRLGDAQVQANFGFLYTNVRTELPFWELTGLFLKFVLAATPVFANERILRMKRSSFDTSSEFNGATQLNMAQFFVGIVFIATLCVQPYKKGLHNVQYSLASGIVFAWITLSANVFNSERTYTEREKTAVAAVAVAISSLVLLVAFIFSIIRGEFKHKPKDASDDKDSARDDDEDVESLKKKSLPP